MTPQKKRLLKQAMRMHRQFLQSQPEKIQPSLPNSILQRIQQGVQRLELARQRGWLHAAERVESEMRNDLALLLDRLRILEPILGPHTDFPFVSQRDLFEDLIALEQEFDHVEINCPEQTISATIEPIELDHVYLGPFKIRLKWNLENEENPFSFRVIAVDPHPAVSNETITHPHVQSEELCEGEGRLPIRLALEQGRLLDFFQIVANLLRTYNSASPYVSLTDWEGVDCSDCGKTVSDEDRFSCEKCGSSVCDQCYYCCPECDSIFCSGCVTACSECSEHYCHRCLQVCSACLTELCQECLNEQVLCKPCHEKAEEENESDKNSSVEQEDATDSPVQSESLGQTAISP